MGEDAILELDVCLGRSRRELEDNFARRVYKTYPVIVVAFALSCEVK